MSARSEEPLVAENIDKADPFIHVHAEGEIADSRADRLCADKETVHRYDEFGWMVLNDLFRSQAALSSN